MCCGLSKLQKSKVAARFADEYKVTYLPQKLKCVHCRWFGGIWRRRACSFEQVDPPIDIYAVYNYYLIHYVRVNVDIVGNFRETQIDRR